MGQPPKSFFKLGSTCRKAQSRMARGAKRGSLDQANQSMIQSGLAKFRVGMEWAAGNRRAMPHYELVERSGPDHAANFTVRVSIKGVGEAFITTDPTSPQAISAIEKIIDYVHRVFD